MSQQPYWWAAVASLGAHGVFFALLPFIPASFSSAEEPDIRRTVPLVELTAEEMRRLPNVSTPGLELPPLPDDDLYSLNDPELGSEFDFSIDPLEPKPRFSDPYMPPIPYIPPPPVFNIPFPSAPPPQVTRSQPQPSPSVQPSPPPETTPPQPRPSESPLYSQRPAETVPELDQLGASVNAPSTDEQVQQARAQQMQRLLAQQQELREQFAYNPEGTSGDAANVTFGEWFYNKLGRENPDDLLREDIALPYPRSACPIGQTVLARFGVTLGQDGAVVADEIQLLQSSGFAFFNQRAEEAIATHEFVNESRGEAPYLVTVTFEYNQEDCPAADNSGTSDNSVSDASAAEAG